MQQLCTPFTELFTALNYMEEEEGKNNTNIDTQIIA